MKTKQIVVESFGGQIQETYLIANVDARSRIVDLRRCEPRLLEQQKRIVSLRPYARMSKPGHSPAGGGNVTETSCHWLAHCPPFGRMLSILDANRGQCSKESEERRDNKINQVFGTL